jgi:hypothetical protein
LEEVRTILRRFISNEYYFYNDTNELLIEKDICLICWLPTETDNVIKRLSDFAHINITCKCKPMIHQLCINDWISKNPSCPICRTPIFYSNQNYLTYYHKFIKYNTYLIKIIFYMNLLYFIYVFLYNIYIFTFFEQCTDIY